MKQINLGLLVSLVLGCMILSSCSKEGCTDSTATNYDEKAKEDNGSCVYSEDGDDTTIPDNYIKRGGEYFELTDGHIRSGLYDGGPNYNVVFFLSDESVDFVQDHDDVFAFTGKGSAAFIFISTTDSLENGTFTADEGWAATSDFDFVNPTDSIYSYSDLLDNFSYIEGSQVVFSTVSASDSTYSLEVTDTDLEIKYTGKLSFIF